MLGPLFCCLTLSSVYCVNKRYIFTRGTLYKDVPFRFLMKSRDITSSLGFTSLQWYSTISARSSALFLLRYPQENRYNPQGVHRDLLSGILLCLCNQFRVVHFDLIFLESLRRGDDVLEDLNLMSALVFVLVCVPPHGDLNLHLCKHTLFQDNPSVPMSDNLLELLT